MGLKAFTSFAGYKSFIVRANPGLSVLYPIILFFILTRVFTDFVSCAVESSSSRNGIINFLNGTVTLTPTKFSSLISFIISFKFFSSTFLFS